MGTKWNGLNRNKPPRKISKRKLATLSHEKLERAKVKKRANGKCETCGLNPCAPTYLISCHEIVFRSAGGKVDSGGNSFGVCDLCHEFFQRYRLHDKQQCIKTIMQVRKVNEYVACAIYDKICTFANKHGLLRKSKLHVKE